MKIKALDLARVERTKEGVEITLGLGQSVTIPARAARKLARALQDAAFDVERMPYEYAQYCGEFVNIAQPIDGSGEIAP